MGAAGRAVAARTRREGHSLPARGARRLLGHRGAFAVLFGLLNAADVTLIGLTVLKIADFSNVFGDSRTICKTVKQSDLRHRGGQECSVCVNAVAFCIEESTTGGGADDLVHRGGGQPGDLSGAGHARACEDSA